MSTASQIQETVGARIREIRLRKNITQVELAERAGMDQGAICDVETGKHASQVTTLERIATALGIRLSAIFP